MQRFARLPEHQRLDLIAALSDEAKANLAYQWDDWLARPGQLPPPGEWRYWLIMAGRGFGKTRIGAEELRRAAKRVELPNIIGATADDARDIMIEGESGILSVCPKWERPVYQPSKRQLAWPNGAKTLIFTADEPERLRGKQHMWLWADEVAAWRYPESWDQAMFGLRLGDDPRAVVTSTPKPNALIRDLIADPHTVVTRGATYDNLDNLAGPFADAIIRKYEGTRLGRQELEGELLEDEGLAYRFSESLHTLPAFDIPEAWERFESMDYGSAESSATAWFVYAVDYDGNIVVFDEFYEPGLPSVTAPKILERREWWHPDGSERPTCWADPAIFNPGQTTGRWGQPAVVADEFRDLGFALARANNDRRAGYTRIAELLRLDQAHPVPVWASHLRESFGAPRLFVFDHCKNLIRNLAEAPLEEDATGPLKGPYPGEAVAGKWEGAHGHAHASLRYGLLSRPSPSTEPVREPDDERAALFQRVIRQRDEASSRRSRTRYVT